MYSHKSYIVNFESMTTEIIKLNSIKNNLQSLFNNLRNKFQSAKNYDITLVIQETT